MAHPSSLQAGPPHQDIDNTIRECTIAFMVKFLKLIVAFFVFAIVSFSVWLLVELSRTLFQGASSFSLTKWGTGLLVTLVLSVWLTSWWYRHFLFGWGNLDRLKFTPTKQAYSTLTWVMGLLITQGLTLAVAEQGKEPRFLSILLYLGISAITIGGIVIILRATDFTTRSTTAVRAFDSGTIQFGRWSLGSALVGVGVVALLAVWGMIPGQGGRVRFEKREISASLDLARLSPSLPTHVFEAYPTLTKDVYHLDQWREVIVRGFEQSLSESERLFILFQQEPFRHDYKTVLARLKFAPRFKAVDAVGFVVSKSDEDTYYQPVYRQLKFPRNDDGKNVEILGIFNVSEPNKDEFLLIWVIVRKQDNNPFPQSVSEYGFSLEVEQ